MTTIAITRVAQGFQISGPDGFEPIVLEKLVAVLSEVRNRANYLIGKPYETLGDKIVVVDFKSTV